MGLEKRMLSIGKAAAVGTALLGMLTLGACKNDLNNNNNPPTNQAPQVAVEHSFDEDGNVIYRACASDPDGYVNHIDMYTNGKYSQAVKVTQAETFCAENLASVRIGDNTFVATAVDDNGLESADAKITFTINPPINQAPETSITAVVDEDTINYTVCGTDDGYVDRIDYEVNGVPFQQTNPNQLKPFCFNFSESIIPGENTFVARATDDEGLTDPSDASYSHNSTFPENQPPETTITKRDFNNGFSGEVDYEVCASDPDNLVDHIDTWTNGAFARAYNAFNEASFCTTFSTSIIPKDNSLEAMAVDRKGAVDPTNATSTFYSPKNEAEARQIVDDVLAERGLVEGVDYEKDLVLTVDDGSGTEFNIQMDYWFKCSDGFGTKAIIQTLGHDADYIQEMFNKQLLDVTGKDPLVIAHLPPEETNPRTNNYLDDKLINNPSCP